MEQLIADSSLKTLNHYQLVCICVCSLVCVCVCVRPKSHTDSRSEHSVGEEKLPLSPSLSSSSLWARAARAVVVPHKVPVERHDILIISQQPTRCVFLAFKNSFWSIICSSTTGGVVLHFAPWVDFHVTVISAAARWFWLKWEFVTFSADVVSFFFFFFLVL